MSKEAAAPEMTQEEAVLFQQVYLPAFIQKCASLGVAFPDEETLKAGLETTALLKHTLSQQQGNVVKQANLALKEALGIPVTMPAKAAEAVATKEAAGAVVLDPNVRQALMAGLKLGQPSA
jgi:hypothetical protein